MPPRAARGTESPPALHTDLDDQEPADQQYNKKEGEEVEITVYEPLYGRPEPEQEAGDEEEAHPPPQHRNDHESGDIHMKRPGGDGEHLVRDRRQRGDEDDPVVVPAVPFHHLPVILLGVVEGDDPLPHRVHQPVADPVAREAAQDAGDRAEQGVLEPAPPRPHHEGDEEHVGGHRKEGGFRECEEEERRRGVGRVGPVQHPVVQASQPAHRALLSYSRPRLPTRRRLSVPSVLAHQRHEHATADPLLRQRRALPAHHEELLRPAAPHRDDQTPPFRELLGQRLGDLRGARRHDDAAVRSGRGEAPRAVPDDETDVSIPQPPQQRLGFFRERRDALDRDDLRREAGEYRRLVAAAGPDLQHALASLEREALRHQGDHVRLGDGLPLADGQGMVRVGPVSARGPDEQVPRDEAERLQHPRVSNPPARELLCDHQLALACKARFVHTRLHHSYPQPQGTLKCALRL